MSLDILASTQMWARLIGEFMSSADPLRGPDVFHATPRGWTDRCEQAGCPTGARRDGTDWVPWDSEKNLDGHVGMVATRRPRRWWGPPAPPQVWYWAIPFGYGVLKGSDGGGYPFLGDESIGTGKAIAYFNTHPSRHPNPSPGRDRYRFYVPITAAPTSVVAVVDRALQELAAHRCGWPWPPHLSSQKQLTDILAQELLSQQTRARRPGLPQPR